MTEICGFMMGSFRLRLLFFYICWVSVAQVLFKGLVVLSGSFFAFEKDFRLVVSLLLWLCYTAYRTLENPRTAGEIHR